MKHPIDSTEELGLVLRAVRKNARVRQDDLASIAGVSKQFAVDVERGKPTVQFGRVLRLLAEMGIVLTADISDSVHAELERLRKKRKVRAAADAPSSEPD